MQVSKSLGGYLSGLYTAMFEDIAACKPNLRNDLERDNKRLSSIMDHHGYPFFGDTLVQFSKAIDMALETGRLSPTGLPHLRPFRAGAAIPRLFKGLLLCVFHEHGDLKSDPDVDCIRFLRQLTTLGKSFQVACPQERIYDAVQEFIETDSRVEEPTLNWLDPRAVLCSDRPSDIHFGDELRIPNELELFPAPRGSSIREDRTFCHILQRVCDVVSATLGRYDPAEWAFRHGPGAVSERGMSSYKYEFPTWSERLEVVFPSAEFAYANYGFWIDDLTHRGGILEQETASRLLAVPKTYKGPRLIAAEPLSNQWCQQSIREFLMDRVTATPLRHCISFRDQGRNGDLARRASHSKSHWTIDLSSASDRISCFLIERLFRRNDGVLAGLMASRTLFITQDLDRKQPRLLRLRKFSTMGSAVTFPVQTILFSCFAVACTIFAGGARTAGMKSIAKAAEAVRVFGDDIIVPSDVGPYMVEALEAFGLKVNTSKTFGNGHFRESCGVDAYMGHVVTPIRVNRLPLRTKPESIASAVDTHNHFLLGGYARCANFIRQTVARVGRYVIPEVRFDSDTLGWFTFYDPDHSTLQSRWNTRLHRREYRYSQLKARSGRIPYYGGHTFLQYFSECCTDAIPIGDRLGPRTRERSLMLRRSWAPLAC